MKEPNKILICDSDEGTRESLKLVLEDFYCLIVTSDASQCLDCLQNAKDIDTLLIGVGTEDLTPAIIKKIKEKHAKLNIVAIANHKGIVKAEEAVRYGASGYIVRPFKSEEVLSIVRNLK